jgi:uncharacterized heparinase superfamily protein
MARHPMKPFSALEILELRNSMRGGEKDYPRELCEHLDRLWGALNFSQNIQCLDFFPSFFII